MIRFFGIMTVRRWWMISLVNLSPRMKHIVDHIQRASSLDLYLSCMIAANHIMYPPCFQEIMILGTRILVKLKNAEFE